MQARATLSSMTRKSKSYYIDIIGLFSQEGACVLSNVWLCVTLWTVAHQAPLSIGFSRQGHWSGLPFPFLCVDHNKLRKALREVGIPDHLTCLLRNLYEGQEATVRTLYGTTD